MIGSLDPLIDELDLSNKPIDSVILGNLQEHIEIPNFTSEVLKISKLKDKSIHNIQCSLACGTSVSGANLLCNMIEMGQAECGIVGGAENCGDINLVCKDYLTDQLNKEKENIIHWAWAK